MVLFKEGCSPDSYRESGVVLFKEGWQRDALTGWFGVATGRGGSPGRGADEIVNAIYRAAGVRVRDLPVGRLS